MVSFLALLLLNGAKAQNSFPPLTAPVINNIFQPDSVALYDKFEARLDMIAKFVNPFDPEDIDVMATFTLLTGKKWNIPGFYQTTAGTAWNKVCCR